MDPLRKQLADLWRKFGRMLEAGVPLLKTLEVVQQETTSGEIRDALATIATEVENGENFSGPLGKWPHLFPPSVQAMVKIGETTGRLEIVCREIATGVEEGSLPVGEDTPHSELAPVGTSRDLPPAADIVNSIIMGAFERRASDIHLDRLSDGMRIRYRVDGVLVEPDEPRISADMQDAVITRIKIMSNLHVAEKRLPQDGRIIADIGGENLDLRVSCVPYSRGECIVMRLLRRDFVIPSLERQGLTSGQAERLREWIRRPNGIGIVTGPTGCGKTTTLYSLLEDINSPEIKIVTVEDPVEHQIEGIDQQQLRPHIGLGFVNALHAELRQDPDVFMVGEIRDLQTMQTVIQAALTGHLVLTTLHTVDAPSALRRMLDIGVEPYLLNTCLIGVMAQRLVRKICEECSEEYEPEEWIRDDMRERTDMRFYHGKGCDKCRGTGYRGRTAIHELLESNDATRRLVAADADLDQLRGQAVASGLVPLRQDGLAKAAEGITTVQEVLRVTAGS